MPRPSSGSPSPQPPGGDGQGPGHDRSRPLSLPAEEFLTWLAVERGRAANTLSAYRRDLLAYERWLAERGMAPGEAGEAEVAEYVATLRAEGRAAASVARAVVAVRSLHRFLLDEGMAGADPTFDLAMPRVPQGLPKALAEDEISRLLGAVRADSPTGRRDRAILEVLYGTGMRISELVGLDLGDVSLDDRLARVLGKGDKQRVVPLGRFASDALAGWLGPGGRDRLAPRRWARRGDAEAVLLNARGGRLSRQGAWGVVKGYAESTGLADRLTPHVLRHSCATHMLDHGADIRVVQELLGHASIATTQRYTKVSADRLRQAYEAAHPRARRPARP